MLKVIRNADIETNYSTCLLFSPCVLTGTATLQNIGKLSSMLQRHNPMAYLHLEGLKKLYGSGRLLPTSEHIMALKVKEHFDKRDNVDIFPCSVTVV